MKKDELFESFEGIDEKYLKKAENYVPKEKSRVWIGALLIAAGLCIVIIKLLVAPVNKDDKVVATNNTTQESTESKTEATTEAPTEAPTEASTNAPTQPETTYEKWGALSVSKELLQTMDDTMDVEKKLVLLVKPKAVGGVDVEELLFTSYGRFRYSIKSTAYIDTQDSALIVELSLEDWFKFAANKAFDHTGWTFDIATKEQLDRAKLITIENNIKNNPDSKLSKCPKEVIDALRTVTAVNDETLSDILFVKYCTHRASDHLSTFFAENGKTADDFSQADKLALAIYSTDYEEGVVTDPAYGDYGLTTKIYKEEAVAANYEKMFGVGTYSRLVSASNGCGYNDSIGGYYQSPGGGSVPCIDGYAKFENYEINGNTLTINLQACIVDKSIYCVANEYRLKEYYVYAYDKAAYMWADHGELPVVFKTNDINEVFDGDSTSYNHMTITCEKDSAGNYTFKKIVVN